MFDTVFRDATPVIPGSPRVRADVAVKDGKIAAIASPNTLAEGRETVQAGGKPLLPGVIDAHTHLGYWGEFETEMESETKGAAVGGVTTAILMLKMKNLPLRLSEKPSYLEIYDEFRSIVERHSVIDMLFRPYPLTAQNIDEIPECVSRMGARGFKFIMHFPAGGLEAAMSGAYALDDGTLLEALSRVAEAGGIGVIHAENQCIIDHCSARLQKAGREDLMSWAHGRPHLSEVEAIQRVSLIADSVDCPIYIAHVSSCESVDFIKRARDEGRMIRAETCPHYLTLTQSDRVGKLAKQKPPIRGEESQERLWSGIREGTIDVVSSDHMPSRHDGRDNESIWTCQWGFPSIETLLPLMLSEGARAGKISLERLVEVCSLNPARIFGLYPAKGHLGIGADADLVLVDMDLKKPIRQRDFPSCSDFSLYEGREVTGWPVLTMVRGKIVARDGVMVSKSGGGGRYVPQAALSL